MNKISIRLLGVGFGVIVTLASMQIASAISATGGNATYESGGYRVHIFTNSSAASNLVVTAGGTVDVLIVGGGGGGGETIGGGGGGGGVISSNSFNLTPGVYQVSVGNGGAGGWDGGGSYPAGVKGGNSAFSTLTAIGGGAGGGFNGAASGTGGSAGGNGASSGARAGYTSGQGNDGGTGDSGNAGGGGGGANAAGAAGVGGVGGNGGAGITTSISGVSTSYAGGGGGGTRTGFGSAGAGGSGGGGAGGTGGNPGVSGTAGTGGGGGGGGFTSDQPGGNGGSGIVIVRYELPGNEILNSAPTNITTTSAFMNGTLTTNGSTPAQVYLFWGTSDGITNWAAWQNTNDFGVNVQTYPVSYSTNITTLNPSTLYYYRYFATNNTDQYWAQPSKMFITGGVGIQKTADAAESGLAPGTFTVYRAVSATNGALTLSYLQTSGSAASGADFVALPGSVTIAAGATNASIVVTPLVNWATLNDTTLGITLTASEPLCLFDASSNASLTITTISLPASPTNTWVASAAGNASVPGNWGLGHVPTSSETVLLAGYSLRNMTWDVTNAVAAWSQTADYNGTVTIATTYGSTFPVMAIFGNCQILGGTWTHPLGSSGNTEVYRMRVDVGGNFTLGAGTSINLDQKGFEAEIYNGYGPGAPKVFGNYGPGASHGGVGGASGVNAVPTPWTKVYGSITSPTNLGSSIGASGGGALYLTAQGIVTIDGLITAVGGAQSYVAAAAGGSILIEAGSMAGVGTLSVEGGGTGAGGSGGGGRMAVKLATGSTFGAVAMKAYGGYSWLDPSHNSAAAGTIYLQVAGQAEGEGTVIIDNNHYVTTSAMTMATPNEPDWNHFSQVILSNRGFLALNTNTLLNLGPDTKLVGYGAAQSFIAAFSTNCLQLPATWTLAGYTFQIFTNLYLGGDLTVSNGTLELAGGWNVPVVVAGNVHIATNGVITHSANSIAETYRLQLQVGGDLTVDVGGRIDVTGKGYGNSQGPGRGNGQNHNYHAAASHGGLGGYPESDPIVNFADPGFYMPYWTTYGSITSPTNLGSGGMVSGGGAISLKVSGATSLQGSLIAKGMDTWASGAAGGSILLITSTLTGNGAIDASAGASGQCGGGGGRIAVKLTLGTSVDTVSMRAFGGSSYKGAAGTIYCETADAGVGRGTLTIFGDATPYRTDTITAIPSATNAPMVERLSLKYVTLVATNYANVSILTNITMGNLFLRDDSSKLRLNGKTLTLKAVYHADWGTTNRVVYASGEIIWDPGAGTVFTIR